MRRSYISIRALASKMAKEDYKKLYYNSLEEAVTYIEDIFHAITDEIQAGNNVKIPGFGSFSIQKRKAMRGKNIRTGEPVEIPSKNYVSFKSGEWLKRAVNDGKFVKK